MESEAKQEEPQHPNESDVKAGADAGGNYNVITYIDSTKQEDSKIANADGTSQEPTKNAEDNKENSQETNNKDGEESKQEGLKVSTKDSRK